MRLTIKCACERDNCESTLEIQGNDIMLIREIAGVYDTLASIQLSPPVAKAIRDACKVMEENDVDY